MPFLNKVLPGSSFAAAIFQTFTKNPQVDGFYQPI